jgi:hypothetical protein
MVWESEASDKGFRSPVKGDRLEGHLAVRTYGRWIKRNDTAVRSGQYEDSAGFKPRICMRLALTHGYRNRYSNADT